MVPAFPKIPSWTPATSIYLTQYTQNDPTRDRKTQRSNWFTAKPDKVNKPHKNRALNEGGILHKVAAVLKKTGMVDKDEHETRLVGLFITNAVSFTRSARCRIMFPGKVGVQGPFNSLVCSGPWLMCDESGPEWGALSVRANRDVDLFASFATPASRAIGLGCSYGKVSFFFSFFTFNKKRNYRYVLL